VKTGYYGIISFDYALATEKYNISYQQIYSWVRKYEANGLNGLLDKRGRTKPLEEMSEAERLKLEKKLLEAKIKDLEIENAILKKLKELERKW
jgi:transposase